MLAASPPRSLRSARNRGDCEQRLRGGRGSHCLHEKKTNYMIFDEATILVKIRASIDTSFRGFIDTFLRVDAIMYYLTFEKRRVVDLELELAR